MVSYFNPLAMYPKSHCANLYPGSNPWYPSNYQSPSTAQLFAAGAAAAAGNAVSDADGGGGAQPPLYYPHMFHQSSSPDWHPESFSTPPSVNGPLLQAANHSAGGVGGGSGAGHHHHHHHLHHHPVGHQGSGSGGALNSEHLNDGLHSIPSPPITVSGSEMSSPGGGGANSASNNNGLHGVGGLSPHHNMSIRPVPVKSPFEWIKRTSYQNQTNPGKTRTKDKYRVVYTDYQRLELEKEYHTSRYITIRRKTELAQSLGLSERQVKIWFQNRRAKERKQTKKRDDIPVLGSMSQHCLLEIKPKTEPDLHLQHPALHQMSAMMHNSYPHPHHVAMTGLRLGPPLPPALSTPLSSSSATPTPSLHSGSAGNNSGSSSGHTQHPSGHSI